MSKVVINTELRTMATCQWGLGGKIQKASGRVVQAGGFDFIHNNSLLPVKCEDMHRNMGANYIIPYLSCMLYYFLVRKKTLGTK